MTSDNVFVLTEYSSNLAAFGDPVLDELYRQSKLKPVRRVREKTPVPERCPGCGQVAMLTRHYYATLCVDCHDSITRLAEKSPW